MSSSAVKYGRLFTKDLSGNLVQIMPRALVGVSGCQRDASSAFGMAGLVSAAQASQKDKFLRGDGAWQEVASPEDARGPACIFTASNPETDQSGMLDGVDWVIFYVPDLNG